MNPPFSRVAIAGTGLIGGSFALAARPALAGARIVGWDKPDVLIEAQARGVIDEGHAALADALAGADLVYVALPVGLTIERLPDIIRLAGPGALITDAASTKRAVCAAAEQCRSTGARFLGGHPMAGNEGSGLAATDAALFQGAKYALIGDPEQRGTVDARVQKFLNLLAEIGARPMWMDAATHDRAVALISHLPQLLSIALASVAREATDQTGLPLTLAGRGLRDYFRLAGSPYAMWRDIVLTNTDNIDAALEKLSQAIEHLRANLRQRELESEFAAANEIYRILKNL